MYNPPNKTSRAVVAAKTNQVRALELRLQGWGYLAIADELGITALAANRYVQEALSELAFERAEKAAELRDLITMRNDDMIAAILPKALSGDLYAVDRIVKLQEQQAKLNGAEVRAEGDGGNGYEKPMILLPSALEPDAPEAAPVAEVVVGTATPVEEPEYQIIGIGVSEELVDAQP